jgi:cobalt-zinc-cadmium efflux system protein
MDVFTAHLMVRDGTDHHSVLDQARAVLADRHHIDHATVQIEPDSHTGCAEVTW